MGNTYIPIKMILEELDIEVVCPPKCSKKTLELGSKCSPEFICVPFKLNMGNYIEGINLGADTVFMLSGCGPCRFGVYHALQNDILKDLGYNVEFLTSDRFSSLKGLIEFLETLNKASKKASYIKILRTFKKGFKILKLADDVHDLTNKIRPREINKGDVDKITQKFEKDILKAYGYKETLEVLKDYKEKLLNIEIDKDKELLKIAVIGEIYTIIESFININIEKKLGNMGVEVYRCESATEFVLEQLEFLPFVHSEKEIIYKAASPYLNTPIGGHGINTIGNAVRFSDKGYDGLIHLLPFTCMPEIVARSILPTIEKDKDIPILTLVLDEMTGEAGYLTRLEAFTDLLKQRREINDHGTCLSWN